MTIGELKNCVGSLQEQLDNSEAVQKDFVRLSQSLQIELEKIRKENTEVRWQHDEDVIDCQGCKETFPSPKKKVSQVFSFPTSIIILTIFLGPL